MRRDCQIPLRNRAIPDQPNKQFPEFFCFRRGDYIPGVS
jgi:hypothetical protein